MSHTPTTPGAPDEPRLKHPSHINEFVLYRMHNLTRVAVQGVGMMFRRESALVGATGASWHSLGSSPTLTSHGWRNSQGWTR